MLTKFKCEHVGTMVTSKAKVKAFIRVAEIRGQKVEGSDKHCPHCRKSDQL